jgi:thioredoxin 1
LSVELNRDNYDAAVLKSNGVVLVDFWGPLCKPCLALMPAVEQLEIDYAGRISVGKVNSTQNRMLCARLRVMSLPAFILYKDGVEAERLTGEDLKASDLRAAIEKTVA